MKKISKVLALSLSALLLLAGCNNDDSTDLVEDETELTDNSGNGADGSSTKPTGGNSGTGTPSEPSKPVSYEELPVVPKGNSLTKIDGAGIWIYVDNTSLGITGDNKDQTTIDVTVTDTENDTNVSYKNAWWDDFNDNGTKTVRLFIQLDAAHNNLKVDVKVKVNGVWYAKTVTFKNGAYEFEYEVTGITLSASASEVKPGESVELTVKDTTYQLPQAAAFEVSPETAGTVENGKFTAAAEAEDGEVTITATYAEGITDSVVINVNANAKPTVMNISKITGSGIEVYVSKDVIKNVPSKEALTVTGSLKTNDEAYKAYESNNLTLTIVEVIDQGTKMRIYFTQPAGFNAGLDITENFTISWEGVSIAVEFNGNVLSSSAITIE